VLGFWHLKHDFRHIFSFAQKCARKVHFYKPYVPRLRLIVSSIMPTGFCAWKCHGDQNVKANDYFFILWSLHRLLRCCETDCTTLLSLEMQDIKRGQLWYARNYPLPETLVFLNCAYALVWSRLKFFCLCLTESTRVDLLPLILVWKCTDGLGLTSCRWLIHCWSAEPSGGKRLR